MGKLLFVYGTLKRGQPLHYLLASARFLGVGRVRGYALYDLGEYPAARPAEPQNFVRGEIYEVPEEIIPILDEVEDEYHRERARVETDSGAILEVELYVFNEELPEEKRLPEGEWPF